MIISGSRLLVSACLLGLSTRYDAEPLEELVPDYFLKNFVLIPVCPEQLGGLPTPRPPAEVVGGDGFDVLEGRARVMSSSGLDVTEAFIKGAREVERLVKALGIKGALLKARSPSCGLSPKVGVTAAALLRMGLRVVEV